MVYHVVNRAVDRRRIFTEPADYGMFLALVAAACQRCAVDVLAYCVMPNHWHLVLRPGDASALSVYMQWLTSQHVHHYRRTTDTLGHGHVYQGRFRSSVIDSEAYYWNVFRYVEANPLRAQLVTQAEDWEWSSLFERQNPGRELLTKPPVSLPPNWAAYVNDQIDATELSQLRDAFRRSAPFGVTAAPALQV
jgi:putative transposase